MSGLKNFYGCIAGAIPTTGKVIYDHPHINMDGMINVYFTEEQLEQIKVILPKICFKFFSDNLSCTVKKMKTHLQKIEDDENYNRNDLNVQFNEELYNKRYAWAQQLVDAVCKICPAFAEYVSDVNADALIRKKEYEDSKDKWHYPFDLTLSDKRIYDNYAMQHLMNLAIPAPKDKPWLKRFDMVQVMLRMK